MTSAEEIENQISDPLQVYSRAYESREGQAYLLLKTAATLETIATELQTITKHLEEIRGTLGVLELPWHDV